MDARWFAIKLNIDNTPWLHCRGEPFKVVPALELLAMLYAVLAFLAEDGCEGGSATVTGAATTDHLGNAYVVARMMTTSFPLNVILMELTEQLDKRGSWLSVQWAPRQQNEHADALTNGVYSDFDPNKRVPLDPGAINWALLPVMMELGGGMVEELNAQKEKKKAERKALKEDGKKKRRLAGDSL